VQAIAQFTAGLVISFSQSWRLSLVLLAGLPLIGGAAAALSAVMSEAKSASSSQYAKAGGVANEALGAIRTVASLGAERKFTVAYNKLIEQAEKVGIGKSVKLGAANGMLFSSAFFIYALAFWYGSKQVADDLECVRLGGEGCITGGAVITTFFSFLIGAFSLGQLAPSLNAVAVARTSLVRVMGIVKRTPVMDALSKEGKTLENVRGDIEFDVEGMFITPPSLPPSSLSLVCPSFCDICDLYRLTESITFSLLPLSLLPPSLLSPQTSTTPPVRSTVSATTTSSASRPGRPLLCVGLVARGRARPSRCCSVFLTRSLGRSPWMDTIFVR